MPEKPWKLEATARLLLGILFCFSLGMVVAQAVRYWTGAGDRSIPVMMIATMSFQGAALVLLHFFLREHGVGWREAFGLQEAPRRAALVGLVMAVAALPVLWALQWAVAHLLQLVQIEPTEQQAVQALRETESHWDRLWMGVLAVVFAPVAEECLFRGVLYPLLKQRGRPRLALWGTAVLFALIHQNLAALLPLTLLAVLLTLLYEATRNLLAAIVAHSVFNAANFLLLYWLHQALGILGAAP